jgi:glycosyltransferase involved in cell wall biosynthesis
MKVLIFMTQFYQLSGAERLAVELAEELNKSGIRADILSMYTEEMPGVEEAKRALLLKGIPAVHFLGMRIHPPVSSMLPAVMQLRHLLREEKYDIVETSMMMPAIITSWSTMMGVQTRHVVGLHQVFRRDRENELKHMFFRLTVRRNQLIRYYSITDYAVAHWITYSKTSPRHIRRIYNAILDDCFEIRNDRELVRKELRIPEEGKLVIYVGRIAAYKGIDTLFDSLGPVCERHNIYLLYIGLPDHSVNGTREMIEQIEKRIANEQLGERVKFLGHQKDIPRLMSAADLLAHPTRIEGFGLTLAEAMAVGLPIVASNVEAIPEVLAGTDSIMVPPDDPEAFQAAVLRTLRRTPDEAASAIAKGRNRAQDFRISNRTDAMIQLFEDVIQGRF